MLFQINLRVFTPLPYAFPGEREPGPALFDDAYVGRKIDQVTGPGDALAVKNVELDFTKGGRNLVLDDLDARSVSHDGRVFPAGGGGLLYRAYSADIEP